MPPPAGAALWPNHHRQLPAGVATVGQHLPRLRPLAAATTPSSSPDGALPSRRSRHPELLQRSSDGRQRGPDGSGGGGSGGGATSGVAAEPPRPEAVDERYRRADYSDVFQFESRQAFARCIAGGEPAMRLAEAALHVTAEDDAIASHSTVRFPVGPWMDRIEQLVEGICRSHMRRAAAAAGAGARPAAAAELPPPADGAADAAGAAVAAEAAAVLRVAEQYLFEEVGFRMPEYGRSNLPARSVVDHAGVWEDSRLGYLHETLIGRVGHPATLGLLLGEVATRLLARGVMPCAAAIDTRSYMQLPRAVPLPALTRELLLGSQTSTTTTTAAPGPHGPETMYGRASGGSSLSGLNTCTSEVLVEMLRHLKRSYWPFPWDTGADADYPHAVGSHGGFRSAAKAALGDDASAALAAIGKVAAWRLERGIWTSPGAGDLRRARAACERLVLLAAGRFPEERRDLAVLLLHCGDVGAARTELRTYLKTVSEPTGLFASTATASADPRVTDPWASPADQRGPDPFDLILCRRLLEAMESSTSLESEEQEPLGLEVALRAVPPWERTAPAGGSRSGSYLPLTW